MTEFLLLGDIQVRAGGRVIDVGHARQQCVLAVLLLDANQVVPASQIIDRVWGDGRLPANPVSALQTYVSLIRRALSGLEGVTLTRQPAGYRVSVDALAVDVHRFRHLVGQARGAGDDDHAAATLTDALGLWRGDPLAGLDTPWMTAMRVTLGQQRRAAHLDLIDVELRRGRHHELLAELSGQAAADPLNERVAAQYMTALYRSGRQADALSEYNRIRQCLARELGIGPGPALQRVHQHVLAGDSTLTPSDRGPGIRRRPPPGIPAPAAAPGPPARAAAGNGTTARKRRLPLPVPRQLPAAVPGFTGRTGYLAELDRLLPPSASMVIAVISGSAGVGKTALAIHWAHAVADLFPDGQLHVDLRGYSGSGTPLTPAEASRRLLESLGIPSERIPADPGAQAAMYRSLLAGRRMLIVLDNAREAAQVRPLLPGTAGCLVLVTSRGLLTPLAASDGAHLMNLDVLTEAEAREFLSRRLGARRVGPEPAAVAELAALCARLPLALSITAANARARPGPSLAVLVAELRDARTRLDRLDAGDPITNVRTVFSWSCDRLTEPAARMFRLLGLHPGPDITTLAAASLAGMPLGQARLAIDELARVHLLTEDVPGRLSFHDLLRAYAREQARSGEDDDSRRAAVFRMLDYYLHTASAASTLLHSRRQAIPLSEPQPLVLPEALPDGRRALEWFQEERQVLLAVVRLAADQGHAAHAWQLPWAMAQFFSWQGCWHDQVASQETALSAAQQGADLHGQAHAHRLLGQAQIRLGAYADAAGHLARALELGQLLGIPELQAQVHSYLSRASLEQGDGGGAVAHARQSLDLYRTAGLPWGEANALNTLGWCHAQLGEYTEALTHCQEAMQLLKGLGDRIGEAAVLDSLGFIHYHLGQHAAAIECYRRAIDVHREVGGDLHIQAETLIHLGDAYLTTGQADAANAAWRAALAILDDLNDPRVGQVRSQIAASRGGTRRPDRR
jgi:DNA-binding SARP family transcriptional activator/tetratricopeptide (TPR) repeat protein